MPRSKKPNLNKIDNEQQNNWKSFVKYGIVSQKDK